MCCIFQRADTNNNNLVNVCLSEEGHSVTPWVFYGYAGIAIIIWRSDSGGQVEITDPIYLSG